MLLESVTKLKKLPDDWMKKVTQIDNWIKKLLIHHLWVEPDLTKTGIVISSMFIQSGQLIQFGFKNTEKYIAEYFIK